MVNSKNRRDFIKASAALTAVASSKNGAGAERENTGEKQEYYELRIYKTNDTDKKKMLDSYLEKALLPALGRMGIDRIGIFSNMDDLNDTSMYVLIPYSTLDVFASVNPKLLADKGYMDAAQNYFRRTEG